MPLEKPVEQYESVAAWSRGLSEQWGGDPIAEDPAKLESLVGFCEFAEMDPDEMVRTFVLCGSSERVREQVERAWKIADSLVLVPPAYALPMEKLAAYAEQTAKLFYTGA